MISSILEVTKTKVDANNRITGEEDGPIAEQNANEKAKKMPREDAGF